MAFLIDEFIHRTKRAHNYILYYTKLVDCSIRVIYQETLKCQSLKKKCKVLRTVEKNSLNSTTKVLIPRLIKDRIITLLTHRLHKNTVSYNRMDTSKLIFLFTTIVFSMYSYSWKIKFKTPNLIKKNMQLTNSLIKNILPTNSSTQQSLPSSLSSIYPRNDNPVEKFFIFGLSFLLKFNNNRYTFNKKIDSKVYFGMSFQEFALITKELLYKNDKSVIKNDILNLLKFVVPEKFRLGFRNKYISDKTWVTDKCSEFMTFGLLEWLVGPIERLELSNILSNQTSSSSSSTTTTTTTQITQISDIERQIISNWTSVIKLQECRYLSESKCKAACLYVCKTPTQEFFTKEIGLPLYMKPNFTDNSCLFFFGTPPLPQDVDPLYNELCFTTCNSKQAATKCG